MNTREGAFRSLKFNGDRELVVAQREEPKSFLSSIWITACGEPSNGN